MLWKVFILSLLPVSELRGAIPYGVGSGLSIPSVVVVAVIGNLLVIPLVLLFLSTFHKLFLRISLYERLFLRYVERHRHKLEKKIGTGGEFVALFFFTAIPLPLTGAYTASVLAWFFALPKRKAFLAIGLGVLVAAVIVTLLSVGVFSVV